MYVILVSITKKLENIIDRIEISNSSRIQIHVKISWYVQSGKKFDRSWNVQQITKHKKEDDNFHALSELVGLPSTIFLYVRFTVLNFRDFTSQASLALCRP